eukprot:gene12681-15912_t
MPCSCETALFFLRRSCPGGGRFLPDYIDTFLDKLVSWDAVSGRYASVVGK